MQVQLNRPQMRFLRLPQKYRAFVAGYGCVHPDTKIWTEYGLMRISDINQPMRVLSWNDRLSQFQISLSGGSFPKGRGILRRVSTQQGGFAAVGHHRIFSSGNKYVPVSGLVSGNRVAACSPSQLKTIAASGLKSLPAGVGHYSQTIVSSMGRYADAARRYGQRFLTAADNGQVFVPLHRDVLRLSPYSGHFSFVHMGDLWEQISGHIRRGLCAVHTHIADCLRQPWHPDADVADCISKQQTGRISGYPLRVWQSLLMFLCRHKTVQHFVHADSCVDPLVDVGVTSIEALGEEAYYDMQVLDTNNYVDEYGFIHHNSGKTWVGCTSMIDHFLTHPRVMQGYFSPTFAMNRDIFYPTVDEVAYEYGMRTHVRKGDREVDFYLGRKYYGTTICKTMDNPEAIIGFKIGNALVDELDTLNADKARRAWTKIIARLRVKDGSVKNGVDVTTTPEGFKEVYTRFHKNVVEKPELIHKYGYIKASTYDNEKNLPDDYIQSLLDSYPEQLIRAYLRGEFTNLESGSVYHEFDRKKCHCDTEIRPHEPLIVGMDFNVERACAVIFVVRDGQLHAVGEIYNAFDTREQIHILEEVYAGHSIEIYPDKTGRSRKSVDATESDLILLKNAGFIVHEQGVNPPIKERVIAVNSALMTGKVKVNTNKCPNLAQKLEQQVWKNGLPEKGADKGDDINDAFGYPIYAKYRIKRQTIFEPPRKRRAVTR